MQILFSSIRRWVTLPMLITFVFLFFLPFWIKSVGLYQYLGVEILIWMIYALGFNLLLGYTGLPSFGHGAYFGIGAYTFGLVQHHLFINVWLGLICSVLAAALAAALVALFISHRRGIYFALMTIAFGQVYWFIAVKWHSVTGGEDGLLDIR
jgi:branched-chain amino acid transport system permease protein